MAVSIDTDVCRALACAEKLRALETRKNKLQDARRHSYRVSQASLIVSRARPLFSVFICGGGNF